MADWNAQNSDPKTRKLMQGFPPPPDLVVRSDNGISGASFPNTRWAFSHQRELKSTACIRRGSAQPHVFPKKLREDIDAIAFTTMDGESMTVRSALPSCGGMLASHRSGLGRDRRLADIVDPATRTRMMRGIKGRDTQPELAVRARVGRADEPEDELAEKFLEAVEQLNRDLGIPTFLQALKEADIPELAKAACHEAHTGYPVPRYMTQEVCEGIIRQALPPQAAPAKKAAPVKAAPRKRKAAA